MEKLMIVKPYNNGLMRKKRMGNQLPHQISNLPQMKLLELNPPKIVVIGNESHGKSTILERIIGLPLFPKEKGLCTRCVVRVHLRRCPTTVPPIAEIVIQQTSNFLPRPARGQPVAPPPSAYPVVFAALDNIREKIHESMNLLVRNDPQNRMVIDDHEIVVKINLPYCLNLDILDVPGLVTTSPEGANQNLPEVTQNLAMKIIREEQETSIFLLVNDIRVPPNQSRGCAIIQQCKVQANTLGIFTKLDAFVSEDGDETSELEQLLNCRASTSFPVGYGWMAAASKKPVRASSRAAPAPAPAPLSELRDLQIMDKTEKLLFHSRYSRLSSLNVTGIDRIRQKVQGLYEVFIQKNWVSKIMKKIDDHIEGLQKSNIELGIPLPPDQDYTPFLNMFARNGLELQTFDNKHLNTLFSDLFTHVLENSETIWMGLTKEDVVWKIISDYHALFPRQTNNIQPGSPSANGGGPPAPLKIDGRMVQRVVELSEVTKTSFDLENAVRSSLNDLYRRLKEKIERSSENIELILSTMFQVAGNFKLERFPTIISVIRQLIHTKFTAMIEGFDAWFTNFLNSCFSDSLVIPEYCPPRSRNEKVRCYIHWSKPEILEQFPHKMIEKWYSLISHELLGLVQFFQARADSDTTDLSSLVEICKVERRIILHQLKDVFEVKRAITQFSLRVSRK